MDELERKAREAIARLGKRRLRQRIPDDVRDAVLEFARSRRAEGTSWARIAKVVGLSSSALLRWSAEAGGTSRRRRLVPVEVVEEGVGVNTETALVFVAGDYRIEGLDVPGAAELLRHLA